MTTKPSPVMIPPHTLLLGLSKSPWKRVKINPPVVLMEEIQRSPFEMENLPQYLQGFVHVKCLFGICVFQQPNCWFCQHQHWEISDLKVGWVEVKAGAIALWLLMEHLGCVKPGQNWNKLATSALSLAIFFPLTPTWFKYLKHKSCD